MKIKTGSLFLCVFALCACAPAHKDYAASAACQQAGKAPGTLEYDRCLDEERAARRLEDSRREFEKMQRTREDERARRF